MRYAWLEEMTKEGQIRPEARDAIYLDCGVLLSKHASKAGIIKKFHNWSSARKGAKKAKLIADIQKNQAIVDHHSGSVGHLEEAAKKDAMNQWSKAKGLKGLAYKAYQGANTHPILSTAITTGVIGGGTVGVKALRGSHQRSNELKAIDRNRAHILQLPEMEPHREQAATRFDELVKVSPMAAEHPELSKKFVQERLHSGFTANDYQNLAIYQSSHKRGQGDSLRMSSKFEKRHPETKTASPEFLGEYYADVYAMAKEASLFSSGSKVTSSALSSTFAKDILKGTAIVSGIGLLSGLGAGIVSSITGKIEAVKLQKALDSSYNMALKNSDPNKEPLHANLDKARQAFQTLVHFAPHVAVEPQAARAFMNNVVAMDLGPQTGTIKDLADIEEKVQKTRGFSPFFSGLRHEGNESNRFMSGMRSGVDFMGTSGTMSNLHKDFLSTKTENTFSAQAPKA